LRFSVGPRRRAAQKYVFKRGHECKFWLDDLTLAFNHGFRPVDIGEGRRNVMERREDIVKHWLEHGRRMS